MLNKNVCPKLRASKAKLFHNGVLKAMLSTCAAAKNSGQICRGKRVPIILQVPTRFFEHQHFN